MVFRHGFFERQKCCFKLRFLGKIEGFCACCWILGVEVRGVESGVRGCGVGGWGVDVGCWMLVVGCLIVVVWC